MDTNPFPNLSLFSELCSPNIPRYFFDFACISIKFCERNHNWHTVDQWSCKDYLNGIYSNVLKIKGITEREMSALYSHILLPIDLGGHLNVSLEDKRDDFNFHTTRNVIYSLLLQHFVFSCLLFMKIRKPLYFGLMNHHVFSSIGTKNECYRGTFAQRS